ncbi:hypothetical protein [Streptomyces sp. NPDC005760]|uniref:hypothetical protein n=1 Tax=Streptomyces sp. NPDC005760 TaxID=3156718 RepID=UPI0033E44DF1
MEFNEALRRVVGGHWRLLVLCVVVPMLVVGALEAGSARMYVSKARVQASATLPTTDVQANAMLSRVRAVTTSGSVVNVALKQAHITDRSPAQVAHETKVSRLGGSSVFTVKVTDRDPRTAEKLAGAISEQLVDFVNGSGNLLITQLTDREHSLQSKRLRVAAQLPDAKSATESGQLTAQLGSLDQQILDVQGSLRAAQGAGLGDSTGSLLSSADDAVPVARLSGTDLALSGAVGLVTGLLMVTLIELVRPRVAGQDAFGRELDTPVLGRLPGSRRRTSGAGPGARPVVDTDTVVALRRAAARTGAGTVVLTGPIGDERLAGLAQELEARLAVAVGSPGTGLRSGRAGGPHTAGPASKGNDGHERPGGIGKLSQASGATTVRNDRGGRGATAVQERSEAREGTAVAESRVARVAGAARSEVHALRVRALHQVDDAADGARHVLVAVEPDLPPYTELRRVRNLAAATGWPVIGVLGDPARSRPRRRSRFAKAAGSGQD